MANYSVALDGLHDTYRWCLSEKGSDAIAARGLYLSDNTFQAMDVETAKVTITDNLKDAEPVFWESRLCEIVAKSAPSLPTSWRLTDPILFTQNGFIWFDQPLAIAEGHDQPDCNHGEQITAITWKKRPRSVFLDVIFFVKPALHTIETIFLPKADDFADANSKKARHFIRRLEQAEKHPSTRLRLLSELSSVLGINRRGGVPWAIIPWRLGETIQKTYDTTMTDALYAMKPCEECNLIYLRSFAAAINFVNSKVFVQHRQAPDRTVARRVPDKPQWKEINVITLRKAERVMHASEQTHAEVEWSCNWLVGSQDGGFWRRQPVKNANGEWIHEWRWIAQYIKGDLSKPFKPPSKRIYNVTR